MVSAAKDRDPITGLFGRWLTICRAFWPYGKPYGKLFLSGALLAVLVVGCRIALPWPLRSVVKPWLSTRGTHSHGLSHGVAELTPSVLASGGLFVALLVILGLVDFLERLVFARFTIKMVRDLRAKALGVAFCGDVKDSTTGSGDLVARLTGDAARVKSGLKTFLVHVAPDGMMMVGVAAMLLLLDWRLGMVFGVMGLVIGGTTLLGTVRTFHKAGKHRRKEGELADTIHRAWLQRDPAKSFGEVNESSGRDEASLTRLEGLTTWFAHGAFALGIFLALCIGVRDVSVGDLKAGDLLVFLMYAVMTRSPVVRLSRMGARMGKILASGERLLPLLAAIATPTARIELPPLRQSLRLVNLEVGTAASQPLGMRLGPLDLEFIAGSRTAVVGGAGSGKTTLLECIARLRGSVRGQMIWDGIALDPLAQGRPAEEIKYVPHDPTWPRKRLRKLLRVGKGEDGIPATTLELLRVCGGEPLVDRVNAGLDQDVEAETVSLAERKALALSRSLASQASLFLLDDPAGALDEPSAQRLIRLILDTPPRGAMIVTFTRPIAVEQFDRVIELQCGEVVYDGPPLTWPGNSTVMEMAEHGIA